MLRSIQHKIIIPLIAVTLSIGILGTYALDRHFSQEFHHQLRLRTEMLADAVRRSIEIPENIYDSIRSINAFGDSIGLELIVLAQGSPPRVIASTKNTYKGKLLDETDLLGLSAMLQRSLDEKTTVEQFYDEQRMFSIAVPVMLRPLPGEVTPQYAAVAVLQDGEDTYSAVERSTQIWSGVFFSILILMAFLVYGLLHYVVLTPLATIRQATMQRAHGKVQHLALSSADELGDLAREFNGMLNQIEDEQLRTSQALERLEQSEERLNLALQVTTDGLMDLDINKDEFVYNENWHKMLGYDKTDIEPTLDKWASLIHEDDRERVLKAWHDHFLNATAKFDCEYRVITRSHGPMWVLSRGSIVQRNDQGEPLRFIGIQSDINERKRQEKAKDEFISTVNHELRTPLTAIRGGLGLLLHSEQGTLTQDGKQMIDVALRNCDRLIALVNDILDVAKLEQDDLQIPLVPLDIVSVVEEAVVSNEAYGNKFGVRFVLESSEPELWINGNEQRLLQVLANLMSNAAKFSGTSDIVELQVSKLSGSARITIQDYGCGIPLSYQPHVFDKFSQADSSDTRLVSGTGLGLSIAKLIISKHNGQISFESSPSRGTLFFIDLPISNLEGSQNLLGAVTPE